MILSYEVIEMNLFIPDAAYMDSRVLKLSESKQIKAYLNSLKVPIINSKKIELCEDTPLKTYIKAKRTVLFTVNMQKKLPPCKPSADFQFALSSSCPACCEYCYLQTTQGEKPVIKVFVNIDDILNTINSYITSRLPEITTFECASITDPVALEHFTGNLKKTIEFFAQNNNGRLRLVTKFDNVDTFLGIEHNNHTKFRFSINTDYVIKSFEHGTASLEERIAAAMKIASAGYPLGFIVAPIMIYDSWEQDYANLFKNLKNKLKDYNQAISFELIQHRFTSTAKELILKRFPDTKLEMDEEHRLLKWGPYGKFKYVYPKEKSFYVKNYISTLIQDNFSNYKIEYFT